jgi:hypothetical protein
MDNLKDSLRDHKKTVTLTASQIDFLNRVHKWAQLTFEQLKEKIASEYLHELAIHEFGMDPNKDFHFDFHPEKEYDNLTITERLERK